MCKKLFTLLALLVMVLTAQAQVICNYAMSYEQGTYTPITDGTQVSLSAVTKDTDFYGIYDNNGWQFNDMATSKQKMNTFEGIDLGFTFRYNDMDVTKFAIGNHGYLLLSDKNTFKANDGKIYNIIDSSLGATEDCMWLGLANIRGVQFTNDTELRYKVEGTTGKHVFVMQFANVHYDTSHMNMDVNYAMGSLQIRLSEEDGTVQFVFGAWTADPDGKTCNLKMGLSGYNSDFLLIKTSGNAPEPQANSKDSSAAYNGFCGTAHEAGLTFTFKAPKPCLPPTTQPTALSLDATSTSISGSFTGVADADHYLVVCSQGTLDTMPADGVTYAVGDALGNGTVVAYTDGTTFATTDQLTAATDYTLTVFGSNNVCLGGPVYQINAPLTDHIKTLIGCPEALTVTGTDLYALTIDATANATANDIVVAVSTKTQQNPAREDQKTKAGVFGVPEGKLSVGDEIAGGGQVVYVGPATTDIKLEGLDSNTIYWLRAWSQDGEGTYSSTYQEISTSTDFAAPYTLDCSEMPHYDRENAPIGWTYEETGEGGVCAYQSQNDQHENYTPNGFDWIFNKSDSSKGSKAMLTSPHIYLLDESNEMAFDVAFSVKSGFGGAQPVDWLDNCFKVQISADGTTYTTLYTINDKNSIDDINTHHITIDAAKFADFAGKRVQLRFYVEHFSNFNISLNNIKTTGTGEIVIEEEPDLSYTLTPEDGSSVEVLRTVTLAYPGLTEVWMNSNGGQDFAPVLLNEQGEVAYACLYAENTPVGEDAWLDNSIDIRFDGVAAGTYTLVIPADAFVYAIDEATGAEIGLPEVRATYTVTVGEEPQYGNIDYTLDPADGSTVESLTAIVLSTEDTVDDATYMYAPGEAPEKAYLMNAAGEKTYLSYDCKYDFDNLTTTFTYTIDATLADGTYTFVIPKGNICYTEEDGMDYPVNEIRATYTVDSTVGIAGLRSGEGTAKVYDLQGRRAGHATKGIVINGDQKVIRMK